MASPSHQDARTVVVTGIGAVSAFGFGADRLWEGLLSGETASREIDLFPVESHRTKLAATVPGTTPDPDEPGTDDRDLTRSEQFAVSAAWEAVKQAGLDTGGHPPHGCFFGSSTGGMLEGEHFFAAFLGDRLPVHGTRALAGHQNSAPGDMVARSLGLSGPVESISSACAAGTMAIREAWLAVESGEVDVAVAGASDGLCQLTHAGFNALRAVDSEPSRPFCAERKGLNLGEGAGVLVLETLEHARRRGATPLAILAGAGASCDAHHMTAPHPEGHGAAAAIQEAFTRGGLGAEDIDVINAHGTGTPHNDVAEAKALAMAFGSRTRELLVTSNKGAIGHLLGAAGAIEAVASVLTLASDLVPPTAGKGEPAPDISLFVVRDEPREVPGARAVLSLNLAFGGANAALVFARAGSSEEGRP